jgi:hypothetical protein
MDEPYIIIDDNLQFEIENINEYLIHTKNILIKMNILLDTYEINKCLANALNRALTDNKKIKEIYEKMNESWDTVEQTIPIIEERIRDFNKSQEYVYYVDIEDVTYITYYRQIKYVNQILKETLIFLNSNINLIYIYTFITQSFYNEPTSFSNNYIFFLTSIVDSEKYNNNPKIKEFFSSDKIITLKDILNLIYISDITFVELIKQNKTDKDTFIKDKIQIPIDINSNNCSNKTNKIDITDKKKQNDTFKRTNIEDLENKFNELKCKKLLERRDINLNELINGLSPILQSQKVNAELWLGVMLFLYKRYTISEKFEEFQTQVNNLLTTHSYSQEFITSIDTFNDLILRDSVYSSKPEPEPEKQVGGQRVLYFNKYLKYKTKYVNLLKKI